ncbi:hypothetical protein IV38_GL000251 [Lactobacillus selangorensis]|uniref:YggT family protein n=1 Tax=Lactobacillus selangorensis TaxID=81857 RepID=A0A0R2G0R4_9LACO|nr:YggT family protein [Lactobacillus selangorensis]KRN29367.1 hypothetical protein IV38_GL000251 [Lactobacillus selangorensis]KRN34104.1 hypothetical protein IV40_GL000418 [Lactobacillus selangorensis]
MILYWLYRVIDWAIYLYMILVVVYTLLTWIPNAYHSKFGDWVRRLVEPFLNPIERVVPSFWGVNFSPVIAFFILTILRNLVARLYFSLV